MQVRRTRSAVERQLLLPVGVLLISEAAWRKGGFKKLAQSGGDGRVRGSLA